MDVCPAGLSAFRRLLPASSLLVIAAARRASRSRGVLLQRLSLRSGVLDGLSLSLANRFRTTLARFLLLPHLGGLTRIFGANEKLSRLMEPEILVKMSQNAVAHCASAAFGTTFISVLHFGC